LDEKGSGLTALTLYYACESSPSG
ncbi:unnamed protein product, partial [Pseudo-nitzschia multistriata]